MSPVGAIHHRFVQCPLCASVSTWVEVWAAVDTSPVIFKFYVCKEPFLALWRLCHFSLAAAVISANNLTVHPVSQIKNVGRVSPF